MPCSEGFVGFAQPFRMDASSSRRLSALDDDYVLQEHFAPPSTDFFSKTLSMSQRRTTCSPTPNL